jgi:hypothetical protein
MRPLPTVLLALFLAAAPAPAQEAIESLFSKTEAVTISGSLGCLVSSAVTADSSDCGVYSFGLEALINLSTAREGRPWGVEIALGYGQTTGFRSANPDLDLRGAVRALPSVAAYASREAPLPLGFEEIYFGVHTGLLSMHNMRAYDGEGRQYALDGETFELGVSLGLYHRMGFFVEPSYRVRYFPSVDWVLPEGVEALPDGWPRSLDLSGPQVSIGYQFSIGRDDEEEADSSAARFRP